MRWNDILNEMPVSRINYDPKAQGGSFGAVDQALLRNEKAKAKIVKAFQRTPFNFELFFIPTNIDGDALRPNDEVDRVAKKMRAGVHDSFPTTAREHDGLPEVTAQSGVIRVVLLANLSPLRKKMPLTAWTVAHKVGHAIEDDGMSNRKSEWRQWTKLVNQILSDIAASQEQYDPYIVKDPSFEYVAWFSEYLTMRSARDGNLNNGFEIFAEIIAQYLISGRITMKVNDETQIIVGHLNDAVKELISSLVGKVLVEV